MTISCSINHPLDAELHVERIKQGAHDHELPTIEQLAAWASRMSNEDVFELIEQSMVLYLERVGNTGTRELRFAIDDAEVAAFD